MARVKKASGKKKGSERLEINEKPEAPPIKNGNQENRDIKYVNTRDPKKVTDDPGSVGCSKNWYTGE